MISSQALSRSSHTPAANRYIVSLKDRIADKDSLKFLDEQGFRHLETFRFPEDSFPSFGGDLLLVESKQDFDAQQALRALAQHPNVEYAEADEEFELERAEKSEGTTDSPHNTRSPNDLSSSLWGLHNSRGKQVDIDAPEAWAITTGSRSGPIIAVLDTGIDLSHPDLKDNLWTNTREIPNNGIDDDGNGVIDDVHGYNAFAETGDPSDKDGHGTHCAGTIGAVGDNNLGVVGVNWQARIMPIKIFNDAEKPRASTSSILRGISYATRNGARVTSNSYGGGGRSRSVERAFSSSRAFHLMAAGNETENNDKKPHYPSNYNVSNSLAVASIDRQGDLSSFSNYGKETVHLAAPGSSIYSTVPGGRYGFKSGTSMATPHVAGAAGLALTLKPDLSNEQLKEALLRGVDAESSLDGKVATGGRLNAFKTLQEVAKLRSEESAPQA